MVESTLSYLADLAERPYFYLYEPPPETPWRNTKGDRRRVAIHDARELVPPPSLDVEGFLLASHETAVGNLYDPNAVRDVYYREIAELVRKLTGATRVVAFDHNVRSASKAQRGEKGVQPPVRFPHNDYTERSGPQRVRDLFRADEAEKLLANRFVVINVWKPIRGRVEDAPLAVCDARTIRPHDLVETDLRYRDRVGRSIPSASAPPTAGSTTRACGRTRRCSSSATTPTLTVRGSPPTRHSTTRRVRPIPRPVSRSRCGRSCSLRRSLRRPTRCAPAATGRPPARPARRPRRAAPGAAAPPRSA